LCYPDKGALIKYKDMYNFPYIYGNKTRDQETGHILDYQLVGDCDGQRVLIVDDICDGGMTFQLLARDLLAAGAKEVNLFVSHGIFSKGLKPLREAGIKNIYTKEGEKTIE
jgi:ribose-phosphate pyrophosphokinase